MSPIKTFCLGPRATLLSTVTTNELETDLELDCHADTSCLEEGALVLKYYMTPVMCKGMILHWVLEATALLSALFAVIIPQVARYTIL